MDRYLVVKNYERFQHYKDRSPPWVKLYNALLDDWGFLELSEATQAQLMKLWLLASRCGNRIPYDTKYIARMIAAKGQLHLQPMIDAGFVIVVEQDASNPASNGASTAASGAIANGKHDASHLASPRALAREEGEERREETEKRRDREEAEAPSSTFGGFLSEFRDGPDREAVASFLGRLPSDLERGKYVARARMWLGGNMLPPKTPKVTCAVIAAALAEYDGDARHANHVQAFVVSKARYFAAEEGRQPRAKGEYL